MSVLSDQPVPTTRRGTVLIVDDEEGIRLSLRAILEESCDVLEAPDGARALEILRARDVDVVTLDQHMPGEAGLDVLARIKALHPTTVVAVITGIDDTRIAAEAMRLGAWDYVVKPFDVETIQRLVQRALDTRVLDRETLETRRPTGP